MIFFSHLHLLVLKLFQLLIFDVIVLWLHLGAMQATTQPCSSFLQHWSLWIICELSDHLKNNVCIRVIFYYIFLIESGDSEFHLSSNGLFDVM